jgi:hypothetical protein
MLWLWRAQYPLWMLNSKSSSPIPKPQTWQMEGTKIDAVTVTSLLNLAKADGSRGAVEYARF